MDTTVTDPPPPPPPPDPGDPPPHSSGPNPPDPSGPDLRGGVASWWASLHRSSTDRLLGGVAGGLAVRFGIPVLLVRAAFVITAFLGIGFPLYVLGWVLLPNERGDRVLGRGPVRDLVALGAVVVAGFMLLEQLDSVAYGSLIGRSLPWFVALAGLALLLRRGDDRPAGSPVPSDRGVAPVTGPPRPLPSPPAQRPPRPRPVVGPLTWCIALITLAVLGLVELANDGSTHVGPGAMAAVVMIVFGLGLTFSAFRGRARGLILPAIAAVVGLGGLGALDVRADTTAGPFDLRVSAESALPTEIESAVGNNVFDASDLRLSTDRTVGIRQTAGSLRLVLPRETTTRVIVHVGTGWAEVERPSVRTALYDREQTTRWVADGLPTSGTTLSASEYRRWTSSSWGQTTRRLARSGAVFVADQGSDAELTLDVDLGVGDLTIVDPRWADVPSSIVTPEQLCTVGGGARGVVRPCSEVPDANRVALCINEAGYLVDCREDRPGTADFPRIAACQAADGSQLDCLVLGIEPVGAQLISPVDPDAVVDDTIPPPDPSSEADPSDPSVDEATNADPSVTDPTVTDPWGGPPGTVPPPTPGVTVPLVPTPGG